MDERIKVQKRYVNGQGKWAGSKKYERRPKILDRVYAFSRTLLCILIIKSQLVSKSPVIDSSDNRTGLYKSTINIDNNNNNHKHNTT